MSSLLSGALITVNMAAGHLTDHTRCLKVSHSFAVCYFLSPFMSCSLIFMFQELFQNFKALCFVFKTGGSLQILHCRWFSEVIYD